MIIISIIIHEKVAVDGRKNKTKVETKDTTFFREPWTMAKGFNMQLQQNLFVLLNYLIDFLIVT